MQPASEDFIRPLLTDPVRLVEPMKRIRELFPNACALSYERDLVTNPRAAGPARPTATAVPAQVVSDFMTLVRGQPPSAAENDILAPYLGNFDAAEEVAA